MITVIADDITGAAEMAGIGFRFGLRTSLITETGGPLPDCDVLVVATDTRSMSEQEAVDETHRIVRELVKGGASNFFKKTDSALRGHVVPELCALLEETSYTRVLYLPENPSKGRIVREGVYYINETPLHETQFAFDPEFPATTSVVTERLPGVQRLIYPIDSPFVPKEGVPPIYIADAELDIHITLQLALSADPQVLLAGGADLFTTFIRVMSKNVKKYGTTSLLPFAGLQSGNALIVCGSTQSSSLSEQDYVRKHGICTKQMPEAVFNGTSSAEDWMTELKAEYAASRAMILTIGYPSKGGKEFALRLRNTLSEAVSALVGEACPEELVIEGGATAFAILKALGWSRFRLTDEVAPGVVRMQWTGGENVHVTLKPGSYPWGELFQCE